MRQFANENNCGNTCCTDTCVPSAVHFLASIYEDHDVILWWHMGLVWGRKNCNLLSYISEQMQSGEVAILKCSHRAILWHCFYAHLSKPAGGFKLCLLRVGCINFLRDDSHTKSCSDWLCIQRAYTQCIISFFPVCSGWIARLLRPVCRRGEES